jgi:hypothetical protein
MFNYNAHQLRINLITVNIACSIIFPYRHKFHREIKSFLANYNLKLATGTTFKFEYEK